MTNVRRTNVLLSFHIKPESLREIHKEGTKEKSLPYKLMPSHGKLLMEFPKHGFNPH